MHHCLDLGQLRLGQGRAANAGEHFIGVTRGVGMCSAFALDGLAQLGGQGFIGQLLAGEQGVATLLR